MDRKRVRLRGRSNNSPQLRPHQKQRRLLSWPPEGAEKRDLAEIRGPQRRRRRDHAEQKCQRDNPQNDPEDVRVPANGGGCWLVRVRGPEPGRRPAQRGAAKARKQLLRVILAQTVGAPLERRLRGRPHKMHKSGGMRLLLLRETQTGALGRRPGRYRPKMLPLVWARKDSLPASRQTYWRERVRVLIKSTPYHLRWKCARGHRAIRVFEFQPRGVHRAGIASQDRGTRFRAVQASAVG